MDTTIEILRAQSSHITSLETILARAFFPVNEIVRKALPNNAEMRNWWNTVFSEELTSPECTVMVAIDTKTSVVIGAICVRRIPPKGPYGGFWTKHPWTDSHDSVLWRPSINCMTTYEEKFMSGREHYIFELLAVDHAYKSQGIGTKLVRQACDIADAARLPIFVQSGQAKRYYLDLGMGFKVEAEPTHEGYKACILVRPALAERSDESNTHQS